MHPLLGLSLHPGSPSWLLSHFKWIDQIFFQPRPCSKSVITRGWMKDGFRQKVNKLIWKEHLTMIYQDQINMYQILFLSFWAAKNIYLTLKRSQGFCKHLKMKTGLFWMVKLKLCSWKWCCWWTGRCLWSITAVGLFIKRRGGDDQSRCNYSFRSRAYSMAYWKAGRHRAAGGRRKKQQGVKQIF